jgi:hypothetical protein
MSDLINKPNLARDFQLRLLTTVSVLALLTSITMRSAKAADEDTDRPAVWIELGGQFDHVGGQGEPFAPDFLNAYSNSSVLQKITPLQAQNPPPLSFAENGGISFQPEDGDWVFAVSVNFGRSSNFKHVDHQTGRIFDEELNGSHYITSIEKFADTQVHRRESHAIIDFSAGKDLGLGLFGGKGSSTLSFGVRFAQFTSKEIFNLRARPDLRLTYATFPPPYDLRFPRAFYHTFYATGHASRSFRGVGPSLSWSGDTPFVGNPQGGQITFDWGGNVAVLFGKQKATVSHEESAHYRRAKYAITTVYQHPPAGHGGAHSAIVPNIGGFAGATWRIQNFKVSAGYRADFFFGAIDGGIDARKSENLGFYGPFATVSVGLGG